MRVMKAIVAEVNPTLYTAAQRANLSPKEQNQIEQMSWAVKKNKELNGLGNEQARLEYSKLDVNVQEGLKFFYKDADYMQEPPTFTDKAVGALKFTGKLIASPLIGLFKVAGAYNRIINEPYLIGRQVQQGENIFDWKVWSDAWNGKDLYDNESITEAEDRFGKAQVYVAKGLLEGKKPGEILETFGNLTPEITAAIEEAFNNPDSFKQVLDATKYAQFSPGRDIVRFFDTKPPRNGGLVGDYIDGTTKGVSGAIDFIYQIVIDPLTWMSGGALKAATRGTQLAQLVTKAGDNVAAGVNQVFKDKGVIKLWDEQFGPKLEKLANASNDAEFSQLRRKIGQEFPGYNNDEALDFFVKNKMFNAKQAENIFADAENVHLLLSGRLDGMTFRRNGVVTARRMRHLDLGFNKYLDNVFNKNRDAVALEVRGQKTFDELRKIEKSSEAKVNPNITQFLKEDEEVKKVQRGLKKIGLAAARNPAGQQILTGDKAIKTIETVRQYSRLIMSRDMSDFVAQKFLKSTEDEQIVIIRNIYFGIMQKAGLDHSPEGKKIINEIISKTHNEAAGFTTTVRTEIEDAFAKVMSKNAIVYENNIPLIKGSGAIHPSQLTGALGPLPIEYIALEANSIKSKSSIIKSAQGSMRSKFAKDFTDFWSIFTLFPRLGIRSAIDEGFMYALTAPAKDILHMVRKGRQAGYSGAAYTGSRDAEGPIGSTLARLFNKKPTSEFLSLDARNQLIEDLAIKHKVSPAELHKLVINQEIALRSSKFMKKLSVEEKEYWTQAMLHHPDTLNSMASSIAARSSLGGTFDEVIRSGLINISELSKALNKVSELAIREKYKNSNFSANKINRLVKKEKLEKGEWSQIKIDELAKENPLYVTLAHFDNWYIRFAAPSQHGKGKLDLAQGLKVAPAEAFLMNNALETPTDFINATNQMMNNLGFQFINNAWVIKKGNEASVKNFISRYGETVGKQAEKLTDEEISLDYVQRMLYDLKDNFHGGKDKFNKGLYQAIKDNYDALVVKEQLQKKKIPNKLEIAIQQITFDDFDNLTKGFQPTGLINTRFQFPELTDGFDSAYKKFGNNLMELMDRQVNGILRQPAVMTTYIRLRKEYAGIEKAYAASLKTKMIAADPKAFQSKKAIAMLDKRVQAQSEKYYTELLMGQAADTVLKFVDNPSIRSNFALNVRTVGRFYRATEDFWRRMYRLKDLSPQVLYRARLSHLGLNSSGVWHEDQDGNQYIMMPMDNILFKATDTTIKALYGKSAYVQPHFNDFTFRLSNVNPSFTPDAGLPMLSGPIAGLSVIAMKNLVSHIPIPGSEKFSQQIDNYALGPQGDNVDLTRVLVPGTLLKLWNMLPVNEKSRQEATAAQQAIAYNAAHGLYLNPNATDIEKYDYLKSIRISAHNVIALRAVLGLISPVTPTIQESKDVPDYLLDVGVTGLRNEFWDIFEAINKRYGDDVQDPYELALSIFTGQNPGKLIYTVARDEKQTKIVISKTKQMRNWALDNKKFIETYGETAYIFGPHTGDFDASMYNYLKAADLLKDKTLENYYDDVLVARDKQRYFDIAKYEKDLLSTEGRFSERKFIIKSSTQARDSLFASNPLLLGALTKGGNEIASEEKMLSTLKQIVNNPESVINDGIRMKMKTAITAMDDFIKFVNSQGVNELVNKTSLKRDYRLRVERILNDLSEQDPAVREAVNSIFNSILKFYSRDTYKAEV